MGVSKFAELRRHLEFNRGGMMPVERVIELVFEPMLEALGTVERWVTLREAMSRSERSEAYFRAPLKTLGGRSRLEQWESEGLAKLAVTWMISPAVLPPPLSRSRSQSRPDPAQQLDERIRAKRSRA